MGEFWPKYPSDVNDGDEPTHAPTKSDRTLLGSERGTQYARRLETDSNRNLYTNIADDSRTESLLYSASLSGIAASTPTAFTAYTAPATKKVYRVEVSGEGAADYVLRVNSSTVGIKRTNLELNTTFVFDKGLSLAFGDSMDVVVDHCSIGHTKDFDLHIYGA